jgi:hypothetical protein
MTRAQDDAAAEERNRVAHEVAAEEEVSLQEKDADAFADAKRRPDSMIESEQSDPSGESTRTMTGSVEWSDR